MYNSKVNKIRNFTIEEQMTLLGVEPEVYEVFLNFSKKFL